VQDAPGLWQYATCMAVGCSTGTCFTRTMKHEPANTRLGTQVGEHQRRFRCRIYPDEQPTRGGTRWACSSCIIAYTVQTHAPPTPSPPPPLHVIHTHRVTLRQRCLHCRSRAVSLRASHQLGSSSDVSALRCHHSPSHSPPLLTSPSPPPDRATLLQRCWPCPSRAAPLRASRPRRRPTGPATTARSTCGAREWCASRC
jgi:hypothetical protein